MNQSFKHLPKDQRKKILLICDDIRVHSGVATIAKEIVLNGIVCSVLLKMIKKAVDRDWEGV